MRVFAFALAVLCFFPQTALSKDHGKALRALEAQQRNPARELGEPHYTCTPAEAGTGYTITEFAAGSGSGTKFGVTIPECPAATSSTQASSAGAATRVAELREASPLKGIAESESSRFETAPPITPLADDELAERKRVREEAKWMFLTSLSSNGLDELETLLKRYREKKERTPSGVWKLTVAYSSLDRLKADWSTAREESMKWTGQAIDAWAAKYPESPSPYLYRAAIMSTHARAVLNDKLARSTFPGGVDALKAKLEEARTYLAANQAIASKDPQWYVLMIRIMRYQGKPIGDILPIALEGAQRFPDFYEIYFEAARAIGQLSNSPQDDIETLANTAAKISEASLQNEIYARIYWVALQEVLNAKQLQDIKWDWNRMKASMNTVLARYPVQPHPLVEG